MDKLPPPASPPPQKSRRIRVHRRRSKAQLIFKAILKRLAQFTLLFLTTGILLDILTPRQLTSQLLTSLSAAIAEDAAHHNLQTTAHSISSTIRLIDAPSTPSIDTITPLITLRRPLYWSPVESLTLVEYPAISAPTILPIYWSRTTLHVVSGTLSIAALTPRAPLKGLTVPRFTPVTLHTSSQPALVLEYASGFMPARMLQSAVYAAFVTGDPRVPLKAPSCIAWQMIGYANRQALPQVVNGVSSRLAIAGAPVENVLQKARDVAKQADERRKRRRKETDGA